MFKSNLSHILNNLTQESISTYDLIADRLDKINIQLYKDLTLKAKQLLHTSFTYILKDYNKKHERI